MTLPRLVVATYFPRDPEKPSGGVEAVSVNLVRAVDDNLVLSVDGVERPFEVARYGDEVFVDSPLGPVQLVALPRFPLGGAA